MKLDGKILPRSVDVAVGTSCFSYMIKSLNRFLIKTSYGFINTFGNLFNRKREVLNPNFLKKPI